MQKTETDLLERLVEFKVNKNRLDLFIFNYGPILVLAQFNITVLVVIASGIYLSMPGNSQAVITWAVYSPVYAGVLFAIAIMAVTVRNFLNKIPKTLKQIWTDGILVKEKGGQNVAEKYGKFLMRFEQNLNSPKRLYIGVPTAILGLFFFWNTGHIPHVFSTLFTQTNLGLKFMVAFANFFALFLPAIVVGYAIGIGIWKSIITAISVRQLCVEFKLRVQSNHPDKAGGLKPLGSLILSLASTAIVASLILSGMIFFAGYFSYTFVVLYSKIFLALSIALSIIIFIWPLISAHERMLAEKRGLDKLSLEVTQRILELEESTQKDIRKMDYKKRQEIFNEIDSLKDLYGRLSSVPTWPFDREIFLKFVTPQVFSILSLIGVAEPIVGAVRSVFSAVTGN